MINEPLKMDLLPLEIKWLTASFSKDPCALICSNKEWYSLYDYYIKIYKPVPIESSYKDSKAVIVESLSFGDYGRWSR